MKVPIGELHKYGSRESSVEFTVKGYRRQVRMLKEYSEGLAIRYGLQGFCITEVSLLKAHMTIYITGQASKVSLFVILIKVMEAEYS